MTEKIRLGDIGTSFQSQIKEAGAVVPIDGATTLEMVFRKPSGTKVTQTASVLTDGLDGILKYVSLSGDIDEYGEWEYWGKVTFSASQVFEATKDVFEVVKN